ncbi:splicing regulator SDE2 isoform X2 [Colius striatus]|uniref:splicing regulator SDE2 isoform X2 n=1 Tax=Colius striatus TaxID=57412 RepID=UPI002B1D4720|nr:splicing regulator SDE2 isoform X2 [Colius striatus]
MALLVRDPLASRARPWPLPPGGRLVRDLLSDRVRVLNIPEESLYVKCNGRLVNDEDVLQNGAVYSLEPRLCGGKGGFGSMLRALGAQIEKTTNREACRDLSGRRLRDVNHEKAMAEWVKQQAEREADKEQRRLERLQRKLAEPKHFFTNPDYQQQCHEMAERLEDSVLKGLQATSSKMVSPESGGSRKRPGESGKNGTKSRKRKCFWLGLEGLDDTDSSDCEDDSEGESSPASDGSCPSSSKYNENAGNSNECSSSSVCSIEDSPSTSATEKPAEQAEDPQRDLQGETHTSGQTEILAEENSKITKPLKEQAQEKNEVAQALKEEQEKASSKARETNQLENEALKEIEQEKVCSKAQETNQSQNEALKEKEQEMVSSRAQETNQSQSTEVEPIDLLAFNSAAEMEALGLDKLKMELMALGLKCGGTLKERAARLFAVRELPTENNLLAKTLEQN